MLVNPSYRGRGVLLTAPTMGAVSGIATHVGQLMRSPVLGSFRLRHFCAGGAGLRERYAARLWRRLAMPFAWGWRLRREGMPIVHLNTALDRKGLLRDGLLLLIAHSMGCATVWQVHGGAAPTDYFGSGVRRRLFRALLKRADRVVVITRADETAYRDWVPAGRLVRIRNSVETGSSEEVAARSADRDRPLRVIFLGRLMLSKGVLEAVDAIDEARRLGVRCTLAIAGTGPAEAQVRARVRDRGLEQVVQLLGAVAAPDKQRLLAGSDLFVLPTYHRERIPYALLEAMAAGAVPIVCAAGDIGDVVVPNRHGFVLEPRRPDLIAQIILQVATDRGRLEELSRACRERIRDQYAVERMANDFLGLYRSVIRP
jgi:glycosyltransferase involved in cell wall biosynthesis